MNTTKDVSKQSTEEQGKQRIDTLQKYISDMVAVEEHIGKAVERQTEHEEVYQYNPQAGQLIQSIAQLTKQHADHLERHLESMGGDPAKGLKEIATEALGNIAGLYDKLRTDTVSKMLRDDYTALSLAAVGYTMLHTTGLALNDRTTADLALRHLEHYTPILMQFDQIIPSVVVAELREDGMMVNESIVQEAKKNAQDAWQTSNGSNGKS